MTANPSHLEAVNPVVLGKARSKQDRIEPPDLDAPRTHVLPLYCYMATRLLPGRELLPNVSGFPACAVTILAAPSTLSSTTRSALRRARVLHAHRHTLPTLRRWSRRQFSTLPMATTRKRWFTRRRSQQSSVSGLAPDAVIDMFCYRRFGHNEGDEPSFTQPRMYKVIRSLPTTRKIYAERLEAEGVIGAGAEENFSATISEVFSIVNLKPLRVSSRNKADWLDGQQWSGFVQPMDDDRRGDTAVATDNAESNWRRADELPAAQVSYSQNPCADYWSQQKKKTLDAGQGPLTGRRRKHLAFGSLLQDGFGVRLSGQDSRRGTFPSATPFSSIRKRMRTGTRH